MVQLHCCVTSTITKIYCISTAEMEHDGIRTSIITTITATVGVEKSDNLMGAILYYIAFSIVMVRLLINMQSEDIDARILAVKLSSWCVVMGSYIGDNVSELDGARCWAIPRLAYRKRWLVICKVLVWLVSAMTNFLQYDIDTKTKLWVVHWATFKMQQFLNAHIFKQ